MKHYEIYLRAKAKELYKDYYYCRFVHKDNESSQQCMHDYIIVRDILIDLVPNFNAELCERRWMNEVKGEMKNDR